MIRAKQRVAKIRVHLDESGFFHLTAKSHMGVMDKPWVLSLRRGHAGYARKAPNWYISDIMTALVASQMLDWRVI